MEYTGYIAVVHCCGQHGRRLQRGYQVLGPRTEKYWKHIWGLNVVWFEWFEHPTTTSGYAFTRREGEGGSLPGTLSVICAMPPSYEEMASSMCPPPAAPPSAPASPPTACTCTTTRAVRMLPAHVHAHRTRMRTARACAPHEHAPCACSLRSPSPHGALLGRASKKTKTSSRLDSRPNTVSGSVPPEVVRSVRTDTTVQKCTSHYC